jgi:hypothetical protein
MSNCLKHNANFKQRTKKQQSAKIFELGIIIELKPQTTNYELPTA